MQLLNSMMAGFVKVGQLTIIDAEGNSHIHGPGGHPTATIRLTDKKLYRTLFLNPELKAGEAYMDGTLICEGGGIRDLLEVFAHNRDGLRKHPWQKVLKGWLKKIRRFHQRNKTTASRKNVQHHYDLSNDFYRLFLDEDLQYSCAYWPSPDITLEQAQAAKKAHIAAKLNLKPGQKVLDIGCGWGGMKGGPGTTGAWIRKYIFPGGYSPALSETFAEIEKAGLWVTDCEILRLHYAETLLEWDKRFQTNRAKVAEMFDERFCRMWEFYLIVSEFSFRHGKHMNFQIQLSKTINATPITRDYMSEVERAIQPS